MNMKIIKVADDEEKKKIARAILEALPEWFGIVEAREEYILDSVGKDFFCAMCRLPNYLNMKVNNLNTLSEKVIARV